ncbi:MAG: hypothetical protein ACUVTG_08900 [Candidatus Oleimicrobiaceae bacterium]
MPLRGEGRARYTGGYTAELKGKEVVLGSARSVVERQSQKEQFVAGVTLGLESKSWVPERIWQIDVHHKGKVYGTWDVELDMALPASLFTFSPPMSP